MEYEAVIGIEVHAQLVTESKLFCSCSTEFEAQPNHNCCPVCLGLPGVLPVLNKKAVDSVIKTALALNCEIPDASRFARKNYYYPDLPKAYQISQYELPIGRNGYIEIEVGGEIKKIRINRVHLEEDTGKLVHDVAPRISCVDYNRVGVPLMEIVSEADIRDSEEASAYLTQLHSILRYIGVCEGSMEKGQMRCEPNISVRPVGTEEFGVKTELKNLNSFRVVRNGVDYEIERQTEVLCEGGEVVQETRRWDEASGTTLTMRTKEYAHDYRYFPDPDLAPVEIDSEWLSGIRSEIPELPVERKKRFIEELMLPDYDAEVLTATRELADYYEQTLTHHQDAKRVSNWIMTEMLGMLNESGMQITDCRVSPEDLAKLLHFIGDGTISGSIAKEVFKDMFADGTPAEEIIKKKNLVQVSDESELGGIIEKVINDNPGPANDYREGKKKAIGFLVGQVMKATQGKANPKVVNKLLRDKLE